MTVNQKVTDLGIKIDSAKLNPLVKGQLHRWVNREELTHLLREQFCL